MGEKTSMLRRAGAAPKVLGVVALAAALALSACGRKGSLEPPQSSLTPAAPAVTAPV